MCHLGEEPQDVTNFKARFSWGRKHQQLCFALTPGCQGMAGGHGSHLSRRPARAACPYSLQSCGWRAGAAPNPHETLRQKVRQFVYWQISAENHEPYIPRSSVPCYIRVVTIPLGKVQKINKQAKLVLTYQGEGSEQRGCCR